MIFSLSLNVGVWLPDFDIWIKLKEMHCMAFFARVLAAYKKRAFWELKMLKSLVPVGRLMRSESVVTSQ